MWPDRPAAANAATSSRLSRPADLIPERQPSRAAANRTCRIQSDLDFFAFLAAASISSTSEGISRQKSRAALRLCLCSGERRIHC